MSLVLPFAAWPLDDRRLWQNLFAPGGPLDDRGPLIHLRETSRQTLMSRYGRWLGWLSADRPETLAHAPLDRTTMDHLHDWLRALDHTAPMTRLMFVDGVLRIAMAAGPDRDWSAQRRLKARLKQAAGRGDPARKQGRILSSMHLLEVATEVSETAMARPEGTLSRAMGLRDAAMIALLALLPMRRRSLARLRIGNSISMTEDRIVIALASADTKSGKPWDCDVPVQVESFLRTYLVEARPILARRGTIEDPHLWLDRTGRGMTEAAIGPRIAEATLRVTGIRVPPHYFRDAAATTFVRISPQAARLIPSVLGHAGPGTAERHYIHAQTIEAGRDYAALIAARKRRAR
ncbi:phage integrase family protein [Palleronia aestuarii]|uniref:Phage integrase family protein n=1 Tax=Palleronia aestuarii TaxID=568105 RepID=A0A2W7NF76_9RHOB|nr:tyrosine-type recombinase/integrase [Palleronia aestuarii]PZX09942.1 phage integrase family protein [Palleronia aestuarii]